MVQRAYAQLERAFAKIGAEQWAEMETSLPSLSIDSTKHLPSSMRARMASLSIDYTSLLAAAESITSCSAAGEPPARRLLAIAVPQQLEGMVKGGSASSRGSRRPLVRLRGCPLMRATDRNCKADLWRRLAPIVDALRTMVAFPPSAARAVLRQIQELARA